jgi:predicted MPP superfamily phosphohydrolase
MKSFRNVLSLAVLACAAFVSSGVAAVQAIAVATYQSVKSWMLDGFKLMAATSDAHARPAITVVQAKAFVQRIIKRERPELSSSWRMCPSI